VATRTASITEFPAELDDRVLSALQAASEKKALDPVVLDLREVATFTDYFVITSGTTNVRYRQSRMRSLSA